MRRGRERPIVAITIGLPGCGKTTWADQMITEYPGMWTRVNRDAIRAMLRYPARGTRRQEDDVTAVQMASVAALLDRGMNVIADDTNLERSTRDRWFAFTRRHRAVLQIADFRDVPLATCIDRVAGRVADGGRGVPTAVITDLHARYIQGAQQ